MKSISLPLESIQLSVTEGENWVAPEELSNEYDQAKEQLNKMKVCVMGYTISSVPIGYRRFCRIPSIYFLFSYFFI